MVLTDLADLLCHCRRVWWRVEFRAARINLTTPESTIVTRIKALVSLFLAINILIVQISGVFAASSPEDSPFVKGIVQSITLETDANTAMTTVIVEVRKGQETQTVRISQETALKLGVVVLDDDGNPVINELALGKHIEIDMTTALPDQKEKPHPVGAALATFFFEGLSIESEELYAAIMDAHNEGVGFGMIAQVLWLSNEIPEGSLADFQTLLIARQNNEYSGILVDGSTPQNWSELRTAILEGKKVKKLGNVMAHQENHDNGNDQANDSSNERENQDKKDKRNNNGGNHGKDNGNGNKK